MADEVAFNASVTVGKDGVELSFSPSGTARASFFGYTTPRKYNPSTKEWENGTSLSERFVAFGKLAENLADSVVAGNVLLVRGTLQGTKWQDREGATKYGREVRCEDIGPTLKFSSISVPRPPSFQGGGAPQQQTRQQQQQQQRPQQQQQSAMNDDPWAGNGSQVEEPPF